MLSSDYAKCIGRQFIALSVGAVTLLLGHGLLDLQRSRCQLYPEISHGAGMDDRSSGLSGLLLCWTSFVLRVAQWWPVWDQELVTRVFGRFLRPWRGRKQLEDGLVCKTGLQI